MIMLIGGMVTHMVMGGTLVDAHLLISFVREKERE